MPWQQNGEKALKDIYIYIWEDTAFAWERNLSVNCYLYKTNFKTADISKIQLTLSNAQVKWCLFHNHCGEKYLPWI